MKASNSQKKAAARYAEKNIIQIPFKLNRRTDGDILEKLETIQNKTGYIKQLIRTDINNDKR